VFGTSASLLLLLRAPGGPWWLAAAAGAALGLPVQIRFNLAFFLPVAALWLAYADRARGRQRAAAGAAALVGGMLVVLLPYLMRDRILPEGRHLFAHGLGVHVAIANQPEAKGTYTHLDGVDATTRGHVVDAARIASHKLGRELAPAEVSDYWLRRGLAFARDDPGAFAALSLRKIHLFLNAYEIPSNENFYFSRRFSWVLRLPLVTWGVVAPLAMLGMAMSLRRGRPGAGLLVAFVAAELVSMIPLFVTAHYRLTAVPALLLLGGYAMDRLVEEIEARRWRALTATLAALVVLTVYVNLPTPLSPESYAQKAERQLRFASPPR
jgi:4-amino-4-deoxy-L-arabinose transferase-like glycosyltransferase